MASESGSGGSTSGPDDTDSRPISVSELLARSRAEGAPSAAPNRETRNRRRVGREGAVSVSELTGEIPRVASAGGETPAQPDRPASRAGASTSNPGAAQAPRDRTTPVEQPSEPPPARPAAPFPRSTTPVARRHADDRAFPERSQAPQTRARPPIAGPPAGRSPGLSSSGMPDYAQPSTRDFSAADVADRSARPKAPTGSESPDKATRDSENANAVTGIIPVVDDPPAGLVVIDSDDVDVVDLAAPGDTENATAGPNTANSAAPVDTPPADDFEAYRAFADIEEDEPAPRKGLFGLSKGLRKKKDRSARPAAARERERRAAEVVDATGVDHAPTVDEQSGPAQATAQVASADHVAADDAPTDAGSDDTRSTSVLGMMAAPVVADSVRDVAGPTAVSDAAESETAESEAAESETAESDTPASDTSTPDDDGPATEPTAAALSAPTGPLIDQPAAEQSADAAATTADDDAGEQSPVLAWLSIIGQSLAGLAIGVGLFWGFTELWKWNVYFALVLAVLVIFGIVTFAHLVRRTKDLTTTLLALGVALIVTIGPLVLLAT